MTQSTSLAKKAGFTLVELAIVLVIIGLIVGGVLVGQDLIKAAEIRSTTAEFERYNAAANTFRNKFNGLPGDLLAQRASQFGLDADADALRSGNAGQGDGNSVVEGCAARATALGCETAAFWIDLTSAQLIGDAYTYGQVAGDNRLDNANSAPDAAITTTAVLGTYIPTTPLRDSSFVHIFPQGGRNFFYVGNFVTDGAGDIDTDSDNATPGLTPAEASQIDDKVDDGAPSTGIVRAVSSESTNDGMTDAAGATVDPGSTNTPGTGLCILQGTGAANDETYNTPDENFANELNCNIYVRSSF